MSDMDKTLWTLTSATPPWRSDASIFRHIQKHLRPNGELDDADSRLPDEKDDDRIKFVAGGLDSLISGGANTDRAKMMYRASLRSPVIRNRNMVLQALATWGKANWPADAEQCLNAALAEEVDDQVRRAIENVRAGRPVNEGDDDDDDDADS